MTIRVVILAAGKGTRMRSALPKVLQRVMGRTLLGHVLNAVAGLGEVTVIVGHGAQTVQAAFQDQPLTWVHQLDQRGTGHALQQLLVPWRDYQGQVLVVNGDAPLLLPETLARLLAVSGPALLVAEVPEPTGYGRVFCEGTQVQAIVEEKEGTPTQRLHRLVNAGAYSFPWSDLVPRLEQLTCNNRQREYYLTDVFQGWAGVTAVLATDPQEVFGVNDRRQLSQVGQVLNRRVLDYWLDAGVQIVDPASTTIESTVQLAPDVTIEPGTHLKGATTIAQGARLGPGSLIEHSTVGVNSEVLYSVVRDTQLGTGVIVGPYAHLRGQTVIGDYCRIGNFVELKHTQMGNHTACAHLSYLGDSTVGNRVNIGAGTITANYDGRDKHQTTIADGVKTGSHTVLIAPVQVGENSTIAAGSTISEDVPPATLAIARARQVNKPGWKPQWERDSQG
ncbi:bifunctional UDP-N-acetylglucosamine diphosphorylase/glucosamine-1-phosphate N-acetyltransferase GlmU [Candidatus Cyanaurora vandensis]|uniref:bifunctional UDP-N-acetylglucosamine diphosphorylase/glucosamine-1-phosphate N-acetyltransferase GlmU n=1 Tax=Candidatus Cyanaurora vandensis TaxID=2714958 RepID=UPI00258118AF|nr:bifunctional UDP-N-acetylglucosamine diphosphorylase/glucosamine-1-phosphate N-acetyltransferase GlmU [Candidatus Cyanaurora vandensis]